MADEADSHETTDSYEAFEVARDGAVARVALASQRPGNALTQTVADEFADLVLDLDADPEVRCLALTGAGDAFCVGADLTELDGTPADRSTIQALASRLHDAVAQLHRTATPLVVGINGVAAGAGFSLALSGDLVLMREDARLKYAYSQLGLTGDGGSTFYLPRLVGLRRAKEIALLDEPITPERAADLGLVTEVVAADEFDARLREVADELAAGPTRAFGRTKRLLTESFERSLAEQLAAETAAIGESTRTPEYREGYRAFFDDSSPDFSDT